ncbi:hypothetical protein [Asticcacaulis endophyticus]|uniref:Uncharacterized protein n=1 Tax=Asticcacaulis endophyticus TaxID=1395890 RepID=A0A918UYM9_9CAUL|nr:hypothetical protein [Asticcacaulis endophyticus]GGZ45880.1 hypothetical protein GCM10011273_35630 [Asticcacaulis endophyticus]
MKRNEMVQNGARQLFAAEDSLEQSVVDVATLIASLSQMRLDGQLSACYGQKALKAVTASLNMVVDARGVLLEAHEELKDVKTQLGCRTVAVGNMPKPSAGMTPDVWVETTEDNTNEQIAA